MSEAVKKDPNQGRKFLVFQSDQTVNRRVYQAGEVPAQWFEPAVVKSLVESGRARIATDEERDRAIATEAKGEKLVLSPKPSLVDAEETFELP